MQIDFKWLSEELQNPLWYLKVAPLVKELNALSKTSNDEYQVLKEKVYDFFEEALLNGTVALGDEVGIWDEERVPVDRIIIHDTSNPPYLRPSRLSAIVLWRLYVPCYANPTEADRETVHGKPISSGHMRGNNQVFYPYHWMIHEDGTATRLLSDAEVGWQAGKWAMNCRSVAICFDGDFEDTTPDRTMIASAARIILKRYSEIVEVVKDRRTLEKIILGHCEVNLETPCPSRLFLSGGGKRGWKEDLLDLVLREIDIE
jgi:hypothetical protein